nr:hypothetical protein [Candidatus Vallotia cooleyia]
MTIQTGVLIKIAKGWPKRRYTPGIFVEQRLLATRFAAAAIAKTGAPVFSYKCKSLDEY